MKKVLLTGGTGLIGKYTIEPLLKAGFKVFVVSSKNRKKLNGVEIIQADLLNFDDIKKVFEKVKPHYILHFAWDTTPGSYLESDLNFKWLNSSLEMLKQFKIHGGKRAIYAGTCFEYKFKNQPLAETDKLNPQTTYAKCKNELREKAQIFCIENKINFCWGRIFYVYGECEQEKRLIPTVIKTLAHNKVFSTKSADLIRDYMFAQDVARAFVILLDSNVTGCVNICTAIPISIKEIICTIARKMNKEHLIKIENEASNDAPIILGDNSRLKNELHFEAEFSLESSLDIILKKNLY